MLLLKMFGRLLCALGLVLFYGLGGAQAQPTQASNFVVEEDRQVWRFLADQSSSLDKRLVFRALSAEGAQALTSVPLSYQEGWQTLELLEAHTLKPDGRQVELLPETIQKQSGLLGGSTGMTWPEYRGWQLKFPDVQSGDRVVLHYRLTQYKPFLPDWQSFQWFANHSFATRALSIEVQAPHEMALAIDAQGVERSRDDANGLQIHRFGTRVDAAPAENDARNASTTVARVLVSSLPGNEALADRFARGVDGKTVLGPALRELALRQTDGLTDPAAKTRALYDWVRKNIRYNAVYIGAGGWVPNDIDRILQARYGDCKDHVLLLLSLLKAVDIPALPALINTGNDYVLNTVASGFNHVIVYVPGLDIYLDPTGAQTPWGQLPFGDRGKPVLLARAAGSSVARTPALTPDGNRVDIQGDYTLGANGALTGALRINGSGRAAELLQQRLAQTPQGDGVLAVKRWLDQAKHAGSGTLRYPPIDRDKAEQALAVDLEITDYLASVDAGSLALSPNVPAFGAYVGNHIGNFTAAQRRFAMPCVPVRVRESLTLRFDPKFAVDRIPAELSLDEQGLHFHASYRFENQVLQATREYEDANPSMLCDPDLYARRKPTMQAIARHLRQQLLYQARP